MNLHRNTANVGPINPDFLAALRSDPGQMHRLAGPATEAPLLREILDAMPADRDRLFPPWLNIRWDLYKACDALEIERCSPNDLRRTFGSWLKNRGLDSAVIARLMGHSSTRMVDLVYGKLDDETLARAMAKLGDVTVGI